MRIVIQRVTEASVSVKSRADASGCIGPGLVALVGFQAGDDRSVVPWSADKLVRIRVFPDDQGRMNRSILEIPDGGMLLVPNFTVACTLGKGRRPSFDNALPPDAARSIFEAFTAAVEAKLAGTGVTLATGVFGADMRVSITNDGPVTFVLESPTPPR